MADADGFLSRFFVTLKFTVFNWGRERRLDKAQNQPQAENYLEVRKGFFDCFDFFLIPLTDVHSIFMGYGFI